MRQVASAHFEWAALLPISSRRLPLMCFVRALPRAFASAGRFSPSRVDHVHAPEELWYLTRLANAKLALAASTVMATAGLNWPGVRRRARRAR
jgi:hypothetical protein